LFSITSLGQSLDNDWYWLEKMEKKFGDSFGRFPSASILTFNKFTTTFIEERRVELEKYFKRISHIILGFKLAEDFFGIGDASIPFTVRQNPDIRLRMEGWKCFQLEVQHGSVEDWKKEKRNTEQL
jgi:hypothetical protein